MLPCVASLWPIQRIVSVILVLMLCSSLNRTHILFPSNKESAACAGAQLGLVYDLISGKILSFEKNSSLVKDASLLDLVQPGMEAFKAKLQNFFQ